MKLVLLPPVTDKAAFTETIINCKVVEQVRIGKRLAPTICKCYSSSSFINKASQWFSIPRLCSQRILPR